MVPSLKFKVFFKFKFFLNPGVNCMVEDRGPISFFRMWISVFPIAFIEDCLFSLSVLDSFVKY